MSQYTLELPGLLGNKMLGFMAALGILRTLTRIWPDEDVKLSWKADPIPVPVLHTNSPKHKDALLEALGEAFEGSHKDWQFNLLIDDPKGPTGKNATEKEKSEYIREKNAGKFDFETFHKFSQEALTNTAKSEWLTALGSEISTKPDEAGNTLLRTMTGGSGQNFIGSLYGLAKHTTEENLEQSIFHPWTYQDGLSKRFYLKWDPMEDNQGAYKMANDPKGRYEQGANRLALEAIPLFTAIPTHTKTETVGFRLKKERGKRLEAYFCWPIWSEPMSLRVIKAITRLPEIVSFTPDYDKLKLRGVDMIYSAKRCSFNDKNPGSCVFSAGVPVSPAVND